jgi:hypothetical protein
MARFHTGRHRTDDQEMAMNTKSDRPPPPERRDDRSKQADPRATHAPAPATGEGQDAREAPPGPQPGERPIADVDRKVRGGDA